MVQPAILPASPARLQAPQQTHHRRRYKRMEGEALQFLDPSVRTLSKFCSRRKFLDLIIGGGSSELLALVMD
jgi:hypothetical protein